MYVLRFILPAWIILQLTAPLIPASKILAIFPVVSKTHIVMHKLLMKNLAAKGHQVTVLSFFHETSSVNYTHVNLTNTSEQWYVDSLSPEQAKRVFGYRKYVEWLVSATVDRYRCNVVYSNVYIRTLLLSASENPESRPDLLMFEAFHVPCYSSLGEKLNVPVIVSTGLTFIPGIDYAVGNTLHPAYWPSPTTDHTQTMNFYERLINSLHFVTIYVVHHLIPVKISLNLDQLYVGNPDITIERLNRRISMIFVNNHFTFLNRPALPNVIEIGGMHIRNAKPLPMNIEKFIRESEHGVILFSFGSVIKFSSFPKDKIDLFKKVFSQIPQRVLWRSDEIDIIEQVPSNVMISKWFPQRDILEHRNVKAFISHCGICSTFEAIYTGKPIVGIPFLYDQYTNVNVLREKGAAIRLDYDSLNHRTLLKALGNIINDTGYRDNMRKFSTVFKDRPMKPLDSAIYWTEYVIKHKNLSHLRVASADAPFYKFLLLDVIAFVLISLSSMFYLIFWIWNKSLNRIAKKTR